ncbi:hypothetical protein AAFF_G00301000 [Aldrovandia affinis]|uniref:VWFD domain-containing protein n=1 Tax=Aldrovandia affinis TaxID=143900 RepID=A0AAD7WRA5_9TELE|nr:hypothetical protein AAFF_G00301000 [Aldrovandia affinis]
MVGCTGVMWTSSGGEFALCLSSHQCLLGKEYYPGDKVTSACHRCVCQHGSFRCVFRPCPSMCTVYGDRHYRTFDGLLFDYVGACKVYLVKSVVDLSMSVMAENVDCYDSGLLCRKSLLISIGKTVIAFDDDSGKPNPSSLIDRSTSVLIWRAGYFTILHVPEEEVTVLWDRKTTIHIQAGPRWQGKLTGLCGNFDLKTVNEMRTPENMDSPTSQEFGNSWTAAECVNSPDIRHPCSLNPLREPYAKKQCGILLSEVFQICHPVVDVTWFYMNCLMDTCGCSRGGDCDCFCTGVSAYAHRCCQEGVTVDWRSPAVCLLGKGPYKLVTYRDRDAVLAANTSGGVVFPLRGGLSAAGFTALFMVTPGLSRARPHDTSLVSFEAAERPNYFIRVRWGGSLELAKFEENQLFQDQSTFVLHRESWISGYDSLEAFARPGFFLHYTRSRLHLMKYNHSDGFRRAMLFRLTGSDLDTSLGPRCQWRFESCVSACFKTCSDPSAQLCTTIPKVEGCIPLCPGHMVLDEVTQRCVHLEDCKTHIIPHHLINTGKTMTTVTTLPLKEDTGTPTLMLPSTPRTSPETPVPESLTTEKTLAALPTHPLVTTKPTMTVLPSSPRISTTSATERTSPVSPTDLWVTVPITTTTAATTTSKTATTTTTSTTRPVVTSEITSSTTHVSPPSPAVGLSTSSIVAPVSTSTLPVLPALPSETATETTASTSRVSPVYSTASTRPTVVSETSRTSHSYKEIHSANLHWSCDLHHNHSPPPNNTHHGYHCIHSSTC